MPDISMCSAKECDLKSKCYRYQCVPNHQHQSYSNFYVEGDYCYAFMKIDGRKITNKY